MNAKKRTISTMVASALMTTALVVIPSTAFASDGGSTVSTSEVAAALSTTDAGNGNLVAEPVRSSADADSAAVATSDGTTVDVPKDPRDGVSVTANGQAVSIALPDAADASNATRLSDGTVAYAGTNGSANAVVPTSDGVQMLTTIKNAKAPTRYTYRVSVPDGGKVQVTEDGRAVIADGDGKVIGMVDVPWAKDANGTLVPTHYETDGATLTQVVDHTSDNYAYPITADPRISFGWLGYTLSLNRDETRYTAQGVFAGIAARIGGWAAAAVGASGGQWMADYAYRRGMCLKVWVPYHYPAVYPYVGKC